MDTDIRNQIVIPDNHIDYHIKTYSNIELAAFFSKNKNNLKILEKLLSQNNNKNNTTELLLRTIHREGSTASIDAIKLLIEYGGDVNCTCYKDDYSLLIHCCMYPLTNIKITKLLIESGADVNNKSKTRTPLMYFIKNCSKNEDLEIIKLLVRKTKINHKDRYGKTPLMLCFESFNNIVIRNDIIKILLDNKADIYIKNNYDRNILNILEDAFIRDSKFYSLIFNYKNIDNDHYCEFDVNFIYNFF